MPTLTIDRLNHEGRGVGQVNGKTQFIFAALPNETVEYQLTAQHQKYDEGKTLKVISDPSPDRVNPPCAHFGLCGGCSLQHLKHQAQLKHKQQVLAEHLQHQSKLEPRHWLPWLQAETLGYRHKARLGVRYVIKKEKVLVGFREQHSHYLADLNRCEVLHPSVGQCIESLRGLIQSLDNYRHIGQIEVAVAENASALVFRNLVQLEEIDQQRLKAFGENYGFWIYLQPGSANSVHRIYPDIQEEWLYYSLKDFDVRLNFHPLDFTQINPSLNQRMVRQAIDLLDVQATDKVLDLFCGLGNFSLPLARVAASVTGIEGEMRMVERAQMNATFNGIKNADFYAANLMENQYTAAWAQTHYDKILIDPPRSGAANLIPQLAAFSPKRLVYVSCNPATFARDAGLLAAQGYSLTHAGIMDMFTHTSHVESIGLFEKYSW